MSFRAGDGSETPGTRGNGGLGREQAGGRRGGEVGDGNGRNKAEGREREKEEEREREGRGEREKKRREREKKEEREGERKGRGESQWTDVRHFFLLKESVLWHHVTKGDTNSAPKLTTLCTLKAQSARNPGNVLPPLSGAAGLEPRPPGRRSWRSNRATDVRLLVRRWGRGERERVSCGNNGER